MYDYECDSDVSFDSVDEVLFSKKALDVDLPEDFDPTKIPQTGEEYIQHVMYEAKHCDQLVVASIDNKKIKKSISLQVTVREKFQKAPECMTPPMEWQQSKLDDFYKLVDLISKIKIDDVLPYRNVNKKKWIEIISNETPRFSAMMKLEQGLKFDVLCRINEQLDFIKPGDTIPNEMGIWIYSILATLELPLMPNEHHHLRELARKCSIIRSNLQEDCEDHMYNNLNLFICIVARYFKQLDLSD